MYVSWADFVSFSVPVSSGEAKEPDELADTSQPNSSLGFPKWMMVDLVGKTVTW